MYAGMAAKEGVFNQALAAMFIISWIFVSKIIISDLYIVVIIGNFKVNDIIQRASRAGRISYVISKIRSSYEQFFDLITNLHLDRIQMSNHERMQCPQISDTLGSNASFEQPMTAVLALDKMTNLNMRALFVAGSANASSMRLLKSRSKAQRRSVQDRQERTLLCFLPENRLRRMCHTLLQQLLFNSIVYIAIIFSCFVLMTTPPAPDIPQEQQLLSPSTIDTCNIIFTVILSVEFILSIISQVNVFV
jgi:hypothetical protein